MPRPLFARPPESAPLPTTDEKGLALRAPRPLASGSSAPLCTATHASIEGPYYRAGAPERVALVEPGMPGVPLVIEGRVTGNDCGRGLANVELDVWHATHDGHYDNDGTMGLAPDRFLLRGRVKTDEKGIYRVSTIVPGRYLNGAQYRPAHVHVKVRANGFSPLTTQLYFPDDPFNDVDPFIHRSLIMAVDGTEAGKRARFDFALQPVSGGNRLR